MVVHPFCATGSNSKKLLCLPLIQHPGRCFMNHPFAASLEDWIDAKDFSFDKPLTEAKWHVSVEDEINFANELLRLHFESALDDLQMICQCKIHSDPGCPLRMGWLKRLAVLIAGATGSSVGNPELRERAADVIHDTCKYLLNEKSDDSILLLLITRIIDTLVNYGSSVYEDWYNHRQTWKLESTAIIEPPINFIVSSHSKGKRRPRWALIDKAYMHNTWRSTQSSYHLFRTSTNLLPPDHVILLMDDLLTLCLHNYETVRGLATKYLLTMMKRWPSTISKCLITLGDNLRNPNLPENAVLGSCVVLSSQTFLRRLALDRKALSSFILGILFSSHNESQKAQKAITEVFFQFNALFGGLSRSIFRGPGSHVDGTDFTALVTEISSMSFESTKMHWRYDLMANRVLLLLAMSSGNDPNVPTEVQSKIAGHFLKNLKSQLPQTRILAISALNSLLKESPYKFSAENKSNSHGYVHGNSESSLEGVLSGIFQEEDFSLIH